MMYLLQYLVSRLFIDSINVNSVYMTLLNHISLYFDNIHAMDSSNNLTLARNAKVNRKHKNANRTHKAIVARCGDTNKHTVNDARVSKTTKNDLHQHNVHTRLSTRAEHKNKKIRTEKLIGYFLIQ